MQGTSVGKNLRSGGNNIQESVSRGGTKTECRRQETKAFKAKLLPFLHIGVPGAISEHGIKEISNQDILNDPSDEPVINVRTFYHVISRDVTLWQGTREKTAGAS